MAHSSLPFLDRVRLRANQWKKLRPLLLNLTTCKGFYSDLFSQRKIRYTTIQRLDDFYQHIPFTTKSQILQDQVDHPPFGSNFTKLPNLYTRFHQTSGTSSGKPLICLDTNENWENMRKNWQKIFSAMTLKKGVDRLFYASSFGPYLGFWSSFDSAGDSFLSIPSGGFTSLQRLQLMAQTQATVLCCTPSYALKLGLLIGSAPEYPSLSSLAINKILLAGEPGGCIPAIRNQLQSLWQAHVFDHHGMTELGPVSYQTPEITGDLLLLEDSFIVEIIHPATGIEVNEHQQGELVLTTLDRNGSPLLRYRTGDLVQKKYTQGHLTLAGGILGRIDEMKIIQGVNLYPSNLQNFLLQHSEIEEFEIEEIQKPTHTQLQICLELKPSTPKNFATQLEETLKLKYNLTIPVIITLPNSLPRHQHKANHWKVISA
jgi:phenylacetate-CoA ligase